MADAVAHVPAVPARPCNHCHAPIVWALTSEGRRMPLDVAPTLNGNVYLTWDPEAGTWRATVATVWERRAPAWRHVPRHVHHGTTCPQAAAWWPSAAKGHPRDTAGVHEKARPTKPDRVGRPSGLAPALHPDVEVRPVQEGMF